MYAVEMSLDASALPTLACKWLKQRQFHWTVSNFSALPAQLGCVKSTSSVHSLFNLACRLHQFTLVNVRTLIFNVGRLCLLPHLHWWTSILLLSMQAAGFACCPQLHRWTSILMFPQCRQQVLSVAHIYIGKCLYSCSRFYLLPTFTSVNVRADT